ncbi:hypothetical protein B0H14DRAFT_2776007 [Mycena olivaceomarginata]|nr:hypothetical protein B0H14DRAFT_2776007 [Mycena olivaceomarginata]
MARARSSPWIRCRLPLPVSASFVGATRGSQLRTALRPAPQSCGIEHGRGRYGRQRHELDLGVGTASAREFGMAVIEEGAASDGSARISQMLVVPSWMLLDDVRLKSFQTPPSAVWYIPLPQCFQSTSAIREGPHRALVQYPFKLILFLPRLLKPSLPI